jgi:uncharacterized membrane protein YbhN (UPF0104 family)
MRKIISLSLFMLLFGIGLAYLIHHKQELHFISQISLSDVAILSAIVIILSFCNGLQLKIITDHYDLNLTFSQWFGISRANALANLWLPLSGATPLKAMYLKQFHQMRISSFIAAMGVAQLLVIALNSGFAMMLLIFFGEGANVFLFATIGGIFLVALLFLLLIPNFSLNLFPSLRYLEDIRTEWREIRGDAKTIKNLVILNALIFCLRSFSIIVAFKAFSLDVSFATAGLIASLTTISGTLNLIPGNFGVGEALILAVSGMQGIGINEGLHVAALLRVIVSIWTFALAPLFSRGLLRKSNAAE